MVSRSCAALQRHSRLHKNQPHGQACRARHGGTRSLVAYIARPSMVRMQCLPNPRLVGRVSGDRRGVHMGWSAPPQLLRLSPTLTLSLYDYALSTAFLNIRLTHDTISRIKISRALFCGVDSSNSTEISLCALGLVTPDVGRVEVRECAHVSKSRSQCLVLHS